MKIQRLLIALTLFNLVLLAFTLAQPRPAGAQGVAPGLGGETDPTYVSLEAKGATTSLKMTNKDGRQQLIKP
jgi:hypothetical protein